MERREASRLPVQLLAHHRAVDSFTAQFDYVSDISRGGLFIVTQQPKPLNATLSVEFSPRKDARMVTATCQVTHVNKKGMGARFISLGDEDMGLIYSVAQQ